MTSSLVLRTTARWLVPVLLVISIWVLLRGHHEPGGGFVGGLVAVCGLVLHALAYGPENLLRSVRVAPERLAATGVLLAALSGVLGLVRGAPFLTGYWAHFELVGETIALGSPLLFDIGVYLTVVGAAIGFVVPLMEAES